MNQVSRTMTDDELRAANQTGRELALMLEGRKPLAMFYDDISVLPNEEIVPEAAFAPHVASGLMVREQRDWPGPFLPKLGRPLVMRTVLFALRDEAWRIPALWLVSDVRFSMGEMQSPALEKMECLLLGYTPEETAAWCAHQALVNQGVLEPLYANINHVNNDEDIKDIP